MIRRSFRGNSHIFRSRPNHGGNRARGFAGQSIDIAKFVHKAVAIEATAPFVPEHLFRDFRVDERIKNNIFAKGYKTPTPVQDKAIPHILEGKDIVGIANTGTGKTAAFVVPLINKVLNNPKERVLVMVPTRELAIQVDEEFRGFARGMRMFSVCVVGGASIGRQMGDLRRPYNFIIGTPGRLKDLIERRAIDLSYFKTVVLDEADRMLDMGFINDVKYMMSRMPRERHTLFFSATMSREIEALIHNFLKDPVTVSVRIGDTARGVDQDVVKIQGGKRKIDVLQEFLTQPDFKRVLVFGRTKHGVERIKKDLAIKGFRSESIHGNKSQSQRQRALDLFKRGAVQVLVATDVAARGLDISGVSHVINFDIPATYDDYVHRIGRTGRAGKAGKALTFVE